MKKRLFTLLAPFIFCLTVAASEQPLKGKIILLDPGHGVINFEGNIINPGKINNYGHREHKLNFDICMRIGALLEKDGAKVIYTRTRSNYWRQAYSTVEDNKARALMANEVKADAFLAIHCDWHPSRKVKGVTTFYGNPNSRRLGEKVHRNLVKTLKAYDRKLTHDSYTVLDIAQVPTVLVECGFMSNRSECKKLITTDYQNQIARGIQKGLRAYFAN